jgi:hypothetical protein
MCSPPLEPGEVEKIVTSAWGYEESGLNRFGQHGAWISGDDHDLLLKECDPAALVLLLAFLRRHQGPRAQFMVTNSMSERLKLGPKRLAAARRRLIELGYLRPIKAASKGSAALFVWSKRPRRIFAKSPKGISGSIRGGEGGGVS